MTKSSGPQPSVHLRVVTTDEGFAQLREPWNALVAHIDGHVFLRHEWFVAAWAWRRSEASLKILCAYADNVLVGVLPLIHPPDTSHGTRLLEYLSVPDAQLCDLLVDPAAGPAVGCAVADHLLATAPMWDQLCIDRLPADSAAQRWLAPVLAGKEVMAQFHAVARNPFVDLDASWTAYRGSLSRSIKKTRNLAANRLERAGGAKVEWVTSVDLGHEHLQNHLDQAIAISARSWKRETGCSLEAPGPNAFIRSLTESAHAQGWLSLWFLRVDGTAVAMEYQLIDKGIVYALRADFDDNYQALCTGTYLNFHMLKTLFIEQLNAPLTRYCMGPGNNSYKLRWTGRAQILHKMTCYSPTMRGRARALWSDVKSNLRDLRDRMASQPAGPAT